MQLICELESVNPGLNVRGWGTCHIAQFATEGDLVGAIATEQKEKRNRWQPQWCR